MAPAVPIPHAVRWELWQHGPWSMAAAWASFQHPCPLFPPPFQEGLELCWTLVQGWCGHCWGCLGPPCQAAHLCFLWWAQSCAVFCRTPSHAVCLGNMWGALLCAPDDMEGTRTWFASWLARAGAWEPLCCFHSSHILVLGRRAVCWKMGCSILECILCCVSPDLALHHYKEHNSWSALCFCSPRRAFSQTETNLCVLLPVLLLPVSLSSALPDGFECPSGSTKLGEGSLPLAEPGLIWGVLLQQGLLWEELSRVCFLQVVKMSSSDPECPQLLFVKVLASRGRLEAVTQQMGYHPQYLDSFLKTQHYLMHMDGPLPFDCRHYIAIMAAARHQCRYLVNLHVLQFLRAGGDPQWLRGLEFIPPKLRNLNEINKILAHRPWLITKEHIEKLLKISEWSWSLAELVHAVVLLAHCHALASFVFGCGCEQDEGLGSRGLLKPLSLGNQCFCEATASNSYGQELLRINRKRSLDSCMELDSLRERMQRIHVETEGRDEMRLLQQDREEDTDSEVTGATNLACYMQDPDFGYQDFARRDEDQTQVFRVQDYSWEDHGFSLVNRLYSDIGHLLDEKFRMVDGLQSSAMAKRQGCEPSVFKRGIWNYIHCMFGIRYDDYDYAEVNQLLERMLKVYIKTVTCYPEKTNSEMFDRFWKQFKHSEKVHVNLLILEARMQAELLYALQAITQYMIS
ncbi:sestrin-3-like isoform X2 [Serinus canaria]|uniref:Sestrin-3-like n=1 Tax=Serinus canaria TaxID=9135 RepID=A0A8C9UIQ0_SERCA|nr:sestrin-3-like isoform X2 [Serinus canaria]